MALFYRLLKPDMQHNRGLNRYHYQGGENLVEETVPNTKTVDRHIDNRHPVSILDNEQAQYTRL